MSLPTEQELLQQVHKDFNSVVGQVFVVNGVSGYVGCDSIDADGPATVRIMPTSDIDVEHSCAQWFDPYWNVKVLDGSDLAKDLSSPWIYGHSYSRSGDYDLTPLSPESPSHRVKRLLHLLVDALRCFASRCCRAA